MRWDRSKFSTQNLREHLSRTQQGILRRFGAREDERAFQGGENELGYLSALSFRHFVQSCRDDVLPCREDRVADGAQAFRIAVEVERNRGHRTSLHEFAFLEEVCGTGEKRLHFLCDRFAPLKESAKPLSFALFRLFESDTCELGLAAGKEMIDRALRSGARRHDLVDPHT